MFGMGTGGSLAPWAPILAYVSLSLPVSGAVCTGKLLANRYVSFLALIASPYFSTAHAHARNFRALHPNTNPKRGLCLIDVHWYGDSWFRIVKPDILLQISEPSLARFQSSMKRLAWEPRRNFDTRKSDTHDLD